MLDARMTGEILKRDWTPLAHKKERSIRQEPGERSGKVEACAETINELMGTNVPPIVRAGENNSEVKRVRSVPKKL